VDALVEFFFKYRPIVFRNSHLALSASTWTKLGVLVLLLAAFAIVTTYSRVRLRGTPAARSRLIAMRVALVLLLAFMLLRPVLVVSTAFGKHNVVGVLVDDSRSMQIADMAKGQTRADVVRSLLGKPDSALFQALADRFTVRFFRVSDDGGRAPGGVGSMAFDGSHTRLAASLEASRQELAGTPLSGVVLVSDGADNAPDKLSETLRSLKARKVPVYTLGIGQERFAKDIEVRRIDAPHSVLKGASIVMNIDIAQRGFGGSPAEVAVEDSGQVVALRKLNLPKDGEAVTVAIRVPAASAGARIFTVRVTPQAGEVVKENNARPVTIQVRDRREKILYVEGEPRYDLKFIRQALANDENIQLVTLLRTARDKFLPMDVDDSLEFADGFPSRREDLFKYRAVILGSIEASFFTRDQLKMMADFVSVRGGGLMMLGGRKSFAEGGWSKTVLADVLPVELPRSFVDPKPSYRAVKADVSPIGAVDPITQIGASEDESVKKWAAMAQVSTVNHIIRAKPGATTLLFSVDSSTRAKTSALAYQRYGLGSAFAFMFQDAWYWRMDPNVPTEDRTYQSFWRQVMRALVNNVPNRVNVLAPDQVSPGEPLRVHVDVADSSYRRVNGAKVLATVLAPSGKVETATLEWSGIRDGEYTSTFTPKENGVYRIGILAGMGRDTVIADPTFVKVDPPATEFFGAEQRSALLRNIAEETGGRYYTPATAVEMAKDLVYSKSGDIAPERLDLWDMPILFLMLLLLIGSELTYRRSRGLI